MRGSLRLRLQDKVKLPFAACLLVYSKMIDKAVEINGEDAFIDNNIPECTISWLKEELKKIDDKCMEIESLYE
ncbi:TPA: hypothetical protein QCX89_003640 [Bacillus cereus]|nr:hypothetical protein [Bacillus cereus]